MGRSLSRTAIRHLLSAAILILATVQTAGADDKLVRLPGYRRPLTASDAFDLFQGVIDCGKDILNTGSSNPTSVTVYGKEWYLSVSEPDPPFKMGSDFTCRRIRLTDVSHHMTVVPAACMVEGMWRTCVPTGNSVAACEDADGGIKWATAKKLDDVTVGKDPPQPYSCGNLISMLPALPHPHSVAIR